MNCPKCKTRVVKSNIPFRCEDENCFMERYFCFKCDTLYECSSDSGDFVEEYLNELGEVECK